MVGRYWRVQVYFPPKEERVFRALEVLAKKRGVSMAAMARIALRFYVDDKEVAAQVRVAASEETAMEALELKKSCRHRVFLQDRTIACGVHISVNNVADCVGCVDHESR